MWYTLQTPQTSVLQLLQAKNASFTELEEKYWRENSSSWERRQFIKHLKILISSLGLKLLNYDQPASFHAIVFQQREVSLNDEAAQLSKKQHQNQKSFTDPQSEIALL